MESFYPREEFKQHQVDGLTSSGLKQSSKSLPTSISTALGGPATCSACKIQ
jgi:hypothetical protein